MFGRFVVANIAGLIADVFIRVAFSEASGCHDPRLISGKKNLLGVYIRNFRKWADFDSAVSGRCGCAFVMPSFANSIEIESSCAENGPLIPELPD